MKDRGVKGGGGGLYLPVFLVNFSVIHLLTSFLDEKVRRIDQPRRLSKSQSPESRENQGDRIMSGRPRTTSFAESCKPVPQPSAFGSMKVSSKYSPVLLEQPTFSSACTRPSVGKMSPQNVSSEHDVSSG